MKRTNTFAVRPLSKQDGQVLRDLLDASAALWNETNYERLMRYNDEDGFEDEEVWDSDTGRLEGTYKDILALEAVLVVVSHEALVIDFVPESGGSVQQVA